MSHAIATPGRLSERSGRTIRARYDSALTTDENRRHWSYADHLSADAANNIMVRRALRSRSSYEVANNAYLQGIVRTIANDTIGTGPTLQMAIEGDGAEDVNSSIEEDWAAWAKEIRLAEKLRIMRASRCERGEVFAIFVTNPKLVSEVKLDIKLVEADQVTDVTWESWADPDKSDGIFYDDLGNPLSYRVLKYHPGSLNWGFSSLKFDDIPARLVFHYFRADRPGQRRGIPELTSSLSIFPDLRRYCAAVIAAAETAADYAMTVESMAPANVDDAAEAEDDDPEAMDVIELRKRMATVLPKGWKMSQTKAEQPTTTYSQFVDHKLAEAARPVNMPYSIAALDSSKATTSARYMDGQIYAKGIAIDRDDLECFLDRTLDLWLTEAVLITRDDGTAMIPQSVDRFPHQWFWPITVEHADPDKVASAEGQELRNGTTSYPRIYAKKGLDWEAEQNAAARSLGISVDEYRKILLANMLLNPPKGAGGGEAQDAAEETPPGSAAAKRD